MKNSTTYRFMRGVVRSMDSGVPADMALASMGQPTPPTPTQVDAARRLLRRARALAQGALPTPSPPDDGA